MRLSLVNVTHAFFMFDIKWCIFICQASRSEINCVTYLTDGAWVNDSVNLRERERERERGEKERKRERESWRECW